MEGVPQVTVSILCLEREWGEQKAVAGEEEGGLKNGEGKGGGGNPSSPSPSPTTAFCSPQIGMPAMQAKVTGPTYLHIHVNITLVIMLLVFSVSKN